MTRAGKSIFYFGFWVLACGLGLFFFPELCLKLMGLELPDYITVRLFGMVLVYLSIYYFVAGRYPAFWPFFRMTVYTRSSALLVVGVLVLLGLAKPLVFGFVVVDGLGALWTGLALRRDRQEGALT
ncbi:MAG: hypothetical protein JRG91_08190 [Deltaproteobacteria bacterium]|nr:hypothetical protein [Deltaproteobacteria bacterium]